MFLFCDSSFAADGLRAEIALNASADIRSGRCGGCETAVVIGDVRRFLKVSFDIGIDADETDRDGIISFDLARVGVYIVADIPAVGEPVLECVETFVHDTVNDHAIFVVVDNAFGVLVIGGSQDLGGVAKIEGNGVQRYGKWHGGGSRIGLAVEQDME